VAGGELEVYHLALDVVQLDAVWHLGVERHREDAHLEFSLSLYLIPIWAIGKSYGGSASMTSMSLKKRSTMVPGKLPSTARAEYPSKVPLKCLRGLCSNPF